MTGEPQKHRAKEFFQTGESLLTVYDKEAYLSFVRSILSFTKDGMHVTYELALNEGPHVVLFGESNATALSGKKICQRL